jgi:hypothetical protein
VKPGTFRRKTIAAVSLAVLAVASAQAETGAFGGCRFHAGKHVPSRPSLSIPDIAAASYDRAGTPVIYFNPYAITGLPRVMQEFIYAHECAHHVLDHLRTGQVVDATQEAEADCWAAAELTGRGTLSPDDIEAIASALPQLAPGDTTHRPGNVRAHDLRQCVRFPLGATARAPATQFPPD